MTREEMLAIVGQLDARAEVLLLAGADDPGLFIGMEDVMPEFKTLLDSPYKGEIDGLGDRFPSFYRYALVLSHVASGIADGSIRVPR